jgi:RNA recognition motif-containing protein
MYPCILFLPADNLFHQVSELAEEQELRDLFERFGRVIRVFLARDRDTQKAKGFAFISFADRSDAARACEKMDGCKLIYIYIYCFFLTYKIPFSP